MDKLLTFKEADQTLRVREHTIMRYLKVGKGRIKESDLEIFFKDNLNSKK